MLDKSALEKAAKVISLSKRTFALTGAGISVESGIPDFRSPNGLWNKYPPEEYATLDAFKANPDKVWEMFQEMYAILKSADPNPGHLALSKMEELGLLHGIVTQNIDRLHQRAGSGFIVEVHGTTKGLHCTECFHVDDYGDVEEDVAYCPRCLSPMKPPVVLFNEQMPREALTQAFGMASKAEVLIIVGTSLEVYPIAEMPKMAARAGATLIEINLSPNKLKKYGAIELEGKAGDVLPRLLELITT